MAIQWQTLTLLKTSGAAGCGLSERADPAKKPGWLRSVSVE